MDMDFVESLASFVNTGQLVSASMRNAERIIGNDRLRVVSIKLLGWMKSQHRMGQLRPLRFKSEQMWCEDMRRLMGNATMFDDILELGDESLDFTSVLADESRKELCAAADRSYNPPLRT